MVRPYVKIPKNVDAELKWMDGLKFVSTTGSRQTLVLDASLEHGGNDQGARPMEAMLSALGSCTGMDLVTILKKKKRNLQDLKINLFGERASSHPHVFKKITMEYLIWSPDITDEDVQWAVNLSLEKYCSIAAMIKKTCKLNFKWRINKTGNSSK